MRAPKPFQMAPILGFALLAMPSLAGCLAGTETSLPDFGPAQDNYELVFSNDAGDTIFVQSFEPREILMAQGSTANAIPFVVSNGAPAFSLDSAYEDGTIHWAVQPGHVVRMDQTCLKASVVPEGTCERATLAWPRMAQGLPLGLFWPQVSKLAAQAPPGDNTTTNFELEPTSGTPYAWAARDERNIFWYHEGEPVPARFTDHAGTNEWTRTRYSPGPLLPPPAPTSPSMEKSADKTATFQVFRGEARPFPGQTKSAGEALRQLAKERPDAVEPLEDGGCIRGVTLRGLESDRLTIDVLGLTGSQELRAQIQVYHRDLTGDNWHVDHSSDTRGSSEWADPWAEPIEKAYDCARRGPPLAQYDAHELLGRIQSFGLSYQQVLAGFHTTQAVRNALTDEPAHLFLFDPPYENRDSVTVFYSVILSPVTGAMWTMDVAPADTRNL